MTAELIEAVVSWPTLVLVVFGFGFAPGFCLRLIVLAYPRGDPRRAELIAELYVVPRSQRPLWVTEQLEVALFEGLAHRVAAARRRLTGRRRARAQTDKLWVRTLRQRWLGFVAEFGFMDMFVVVGGFVGVLVGGFVGMGGGGPVVADVLVGMGAGGPLGALVGGFVGELTDRCMRRLTRIRASSPPKRRDGPA